VYNDASDERPLLYGSVEQTDASLGVIMGSSYKVSMAAVTIHSRRAIQ